MTFITNSQQKEILCEIYFYIVNYEPDGVQYLSNWSTSAKFSVSDVYTSRYSAQMLISKFTIINQIPLIYSFGQPLYSKSRAFSPLNSFKQFSSHTFLRDILCVWESTVCQEGISEIEREMFSSNPYIHTHTHIKEMYVLFGFSSNAMFQSNVTANKMIFHV